MRIQALIVTFFILNSLAAQNLVPNAGFEDNIDGKVLIWQQPLGEFYHYHPRFGLAYGRLDYTSNNGLCLLYPEPSEYLVVKLKSKLQKGKTYCIHADAELGSIYDVELYGDKLRTLRSVEFAFSDTPPVVTTRTRLYLEPAVSLLLHPNDSNAQLNLGSANYVAKGNEQYLIIGKFFTPAADSLQEASTKMFIQLAIEKEKMAQAIKDYYRSCMPPIDPVYKKSEIKKSFARLQDSIASIEAAQKQALADNEKYYAGLFEEATAHAYQVRVYFDNVCVIPATAENNCSCEEENTLKEPVFIAGKTYRLNNIQFDLDKATLKPESYIELDNLFQALTAYPNMQIRINGHTDSLNTEEYNVDLSNRRARAVYDYLVDKGIASERLSWQGFGESEPLTGNHTEEGRAMNRRVEFLVIKNE